MEENRFQYALEHIAGKSVFIVEWKDWKQIVDESGEPIKLVNVPPPISGLVSMAANVMAAGSGICNPSPGIDIVRLDPKDAPYIYNIDHYTVFEHFTSTELFHEALKVARIEESEELNEYIQSHVFVVGPSKENNHWEEKIPKHIRDAKLKR